MTPALLIVNPRASGVDSAVVADVTNVLKREAELEVVATRDRGHATELVRELPAGTERIFAMGGDGLFNEVANGVGAVLPVGLLAAGASNVLPRALGLPGDARTAAERLVASQTTRQISLGVANGRRFTFCCGLGVDAEIVRAIDARGRAAGRRASDLTFAWELTRLVASRRFVLRPSMEVVGHGRCSFAIVANGNPYTYAGRLPVHATPLARFEAGVDVVAPRRLGPAGIAGLAWAVLVRPGRQTRSDTFVYLHDIDEALIRCDGPTAVQVDGEDIGDVGELTIGVERAAMTVIT